MQQVHSRDAEVFIKYPENSIEIAEGVRIYGNFTLGGEATKRAVEAVEAALTKRQDSCTSATFENKSSGGSPTVADCAWLRDVAYGQDVGWVLAPCNLVNGKSTCYHALVTANACVFGAAANFADQAIRIGNFDVGDLTRDSINRFQLNGKVGSSGDVTCAIWSGGQSTAMWGVYHT